MPSTVTLARAAREARMDVAALRAELDRIAADQRMMRDPTTVRVIDLYQQVDDPVWPAGVWEPWAVSMGWWPTPGYRRRLVGNRGIAWRLGISPQTLRVQGTSRPPRSSEPWPTVVAVYRSMVLRDLRQVIEWAIRNDRLEPDGKTPRRP